jgi:hypothetical protein
LANGSNVWCFPIRPAAWAAAVKLQVNLGTGDLGTTERGSQELHVGDLVVGDLVGQPLGLAALEVHCVATDHATMASLAGSQAMGQAMAERGVGVELGLQVLQVEREVQHCTVAGRGCVGRADAHTGQGRASDDAEAGDTGGRQEGATVGRALRTAADHVVNDSLSKHSLTPFLILFGHEEIASPGGESRFSILSRNYWEHSLSSALKMR